MNENNKGIQANPELVINYLTQELANKNRENAILKAIIEESNNKDNQEPAQHE